MTTLKSPFDDVTHTVQISSGVKTACQVCRITSPYAIDSDVAEWINHYFEHGYRLLHVGQQTTRDDEGRPWQTTVAIVGKS